MLLRTFVGGARDPRRARAIRRRARRSDRSRRCAPLLGIDGEPLFTRVYRWDRGNAQHEVGHLDRMAAIDRALAAPSRALFVTGSGFRGVGIPDCVADGRKVGAARPLQWLA